MFHGVPEGKTVKNRVHLDLKAADIHAEADRLTKPGTRQVRALSENNNRCRRSVQEPSSRFRMAAWDAASTTVPASASAPCAIAVSAAVVMVARANSG